MALTFQVFPGRSKAPSFANVMRLGSHKFHHYLHSIGVRTRYDVEVQLRTVDSPDPCSLDLCSPFVWTPDQFVWFGLAGVPGGTDVWSGPLTRLPMDRGELPEWLTDAITDPDVLSTARHWDRDWLFRRSAGQPALVVVLYGFLASALAQLTNGLIYSDDGAWDFERFPARSVAFDGWYLRPEQALSGDAFGWGSQIQRGVLREDREHVALRHRP